MMSDDFSPAHSDTDEDDFVSKTQMKKEMAALQELAVAITQMKAEVRAQLPLDEDLRIAIEETQNIKKREALRRHHQYLGRLMRKADSQAIQKAVDGLEAEQNRLVRLLHVMEKWRDDLIEGDKHTQDRFFEAFPTADRQAIRSLVRAAQQERRQNKPPTNARKLFRSIRDIMADRDS